MSDMNVTASPVITTPQSVEVSAPSVSSGEVSTPAPSMGAFANIAPAPSMSAAPALTSVISFAGKAPIIKA